MNQRNSWFELLKSKNRSEKDSRPIDAIIQKYIHWTENKEEADLFILPMDWNYYFSRNTQKKAFRFCSDAHKMNKTVLSYVGGDFGITLAVPENTLVYRQSGYRSKRKPNERTAPFFLSDPITQLNQGTEEELFIEKSNKPIVGFCGMAPQGLKTEIKERLQILFRNTKSLLRLTHADRQKIMSSSNLRFKALEIFKSTTQFQTNYIIRQKYRGGAQTPENREKTTKEYYQNQINSDLVICVRGVGNFSLRFYETLAMGRIPIFVDTDSPLPDISPNNWDDYIIRVNAKDIAKAPEIAMKWLKQRDLLEQQKKNRNLWIEQFRLDNYWIKQLQRVSN